MRDDQHGLAASFEFRQQLRVEDVFEVGVLIGGPLVEKVECAVLKIRGQQSEAFALALGNGGGRKAPILHFDLVVQVQLIEIFLRLRVQFRPLEAEQVFEQIKISEHRGEEL